LIDLDDAVLGTSGTSEKHKAICTERQGVDGWALAAFSFMGKAMKTVFAWSRINAGGRAGIEKADYSIIEADDDVVLTWTDSYASAPESGWHAVLYSRCAGLKDIDDAKLQVISQESSKGEFEEAILQ
jgi:hypothetical protein